MLRKSTNDLTIRPKMSRTAFMAIFIAAVFIGFIGLYFAYQHGVRVGHQQYDQDQSQINDLEQTISQLNQELSVAKEGLIFAQRQQQIQEEAYKQMSQAYANSEQKNQVLGSRLDFYRSIISPEDNQSGPAIQAAHTVFENGALQFDVTLVQAIKHKHQVRGSLVVTLYEQDTATARWPSASARSVSYQYFQQVSGKIERESLSEDAKIKVELNVQEGDTIERWFKVSSGSQATAPLG